MDRNGPAVWNLSSWNGKEGRERIKLMRRRMGGNLGYFNRREKVDSFI